MSGGPVFDKETKKVIGIISKKQNLIITDNAGRYQGINDQAGLSYCEKIQQVFNNPSTSHLDW